MTRKKAGASAAAFRVRYLRRSREIYKRYLETKPWVKQMHASVLGLRPGMRIVDVGCGTGDFTRYLAGMVGGKPKLIGVDNRGPSLKSAEAQTRKEGLSGKITYRKGDAFNIPVKSGWSDLTCCRTLLMHLTDPLKAVREMARVTREGGTVAALEAGRLNSLYVPDDEKLTSMFLKLGDAYLNGMKKLEGKNFEIGERLPTIFRKADLTGIVAEIQADAYLSTDPRRRLEDVKDEVEFYLAFNRETRKVDSKAMMAGGASRRNIGRYHRWMDNYLEGLLRDDEKLRSDTTFTAGGLYLVAGRKT
jgi:ubiquinone/menaquinone biosynthesis C-methylase UbiE